MTTKKTHLVGIGTFAPQSYAQEELLALCDAASSEFARGVSLNSAIETRSFCKNPKDFLTADFNQRTAYHLEASSFMAYEALKRARGSLSLKKLDAVIAVTSTGFLQPGLAQVLASRFEVGHANTLRFNLVGDGCYGAIPGIQLAESLVQSGQCQTVALVCSEANLALLDAQSAHPSMVLPRVLFGEGAAALIFSSASGDRSIDSVYPRVSPRLRATYNMMIDSTADKVGIHLGNHWTCKIDKEVPSIGAVSIPKMVKQFLADHHLQIEDVKHWAFHAGGRKVLEALEAQFGLSKDQMFASADVLRRYGNLSSVSALFSLKELMERDQPKPGDLGLVVAIGPGMITGAALLEWY